MRPLHHAIQAFRYFNLVAFIALGAVTLVFWLRRRDSASRWAAVAFGALGLVELTVVLVAWTFALPRIPQPGEHRPASFTAWIVVFFVHWSILSIVSALSLWRAGAAQ